MAHWDETTDLLVVGTGAGGMTAAIAAHDLGLKVMLIDAAKTFGGTSAMSGGSLWVPANPLMQQAHINDSTAAGLQYLESCIGPSMDEKKIQAYLNQAPEIIDYLTQHTQLQVKIILNFCDYYPLRAGSSQGGRTLEAVPFMAKQLGAHIKELHPPHPQELLFKSVALNSEEGLRLLKGGRPATILFFKTVFDWLLHSRNGTGLPYRLCLGNALVSRLYRSLMDRQMTVRYQTKLCDLIMENNQVVGAIIQQGTQKLRVQARQGVVLATGGFAKNQSLREQYLPRPTRAEWSSAQDYDQGDALQIGLRIGAAVQWMNEAWWMPVTRLPDEALPWVIVFEKALPGSIMVNQAGKRYTNEAAPYTDVVKAMYHCHETEAKAIPSYLILDAKCRKKYPLCKLLPGQIQPDFMIKKIYKEKWLTRGETLSELANKLGLNAENLVATVNEFNQTAVNGLDPIFHRGESPYDNCYITAPNSATCVAPLTKAPFYAIPIYPGDIGTKGGLKTDESARVIHTNGEVVPGLYAIGNCSASMMGKTYPGAGSTLGPAMIFGVIAARDAARKK